MGKSVWRLQLALQSSNGGQWWRTKHLTCGIKCYFQVQQVRIESNQTLSWHSHSGKLVACCVRRNPTYLISEVLWGVYEQETHLGFFFLYQVGYKVNSGKWKYMDDSQLLMTWLTIFELTMMKKLYTFNGNQIFNFYLFLGEQYAM